MKSQFPQHIIHLSILVCALLPITAHSQLSLMTEPSGGRVSEPAPNLVLSLDDSGSMSWDLNNGGAGTPKINILRDALIATFGDPTTGNKGVIADNRIRLAWQAMWDNGKPYRPSPLNTSQDIISPGSINSIKPFSGVHRQNFHAFVKSLTAYNGTPSHKMMRNVRSYMSTPLGVNSPFASYPGDNTKPLQYLACRRTYHVFMTDGTWNFETTGAGNVGNYDGTSVTLPDGKLFNNSAKETSLYRDVWGATIGTLADWAFYNWASDFPSKDAIPNKITPLYRLKDKNDNPIDETISTVTPQGVATSTTLTPYWNPKNNPMTWQGVTQHTIGFGKSATQWSGRPTWGTASGLNTYTAVDYKNLVNGQVSWANVMAADDTTRSQELWHMALNGRGKYYQATGNDDLKNAFNDILQSIILDTSAAATGTTSTNLRLGTKGKAFITGYDGKRWKGILNAVPVAADGSIGEKLWGAGDKLDARNLGSEPRKIFSHNGTSGIELNWDNLSISQKAALQASDTTDASAKSMLDYLKGDRSKEESNGGVFRDRDSRLGSIANSSPILMDQPKPGLTTSAAGLTAMADDAVKNRTPVIFVGANDGMLHAFNASDDSGTELFAYMPRGVYSKLRSYTQPNYQHQFMVDGTPLVADIDVDGTWKSLLVGTLGLGGRGYFVLDVTKPGAFSQANVLLDQSDAGSTGDAAFIGHIASPPAQDSINSNKTTQITKLNNGRTAVVFGNGINSASGRAALLIQYLDGDKKLVVIPTNTDAVSNGLFTPRLVDLDGNGTTDLVYAGDNKGNLWSFDLGLTESTYWKPRFSGKPLFIATESVTTGSPTQPITSAPYVMPVPRSNAVQIAFGTGRLMDTNDSSSTRLQTLYSIRDNLSYTRSNKGSFTFSDPSTYISVTRASLVKQERISSTAVGTPYSAKYAASSSYVVDYRKPTVKGWYFDLALSGERQIDNTEAFFGSIVMFPTMMPISDQSNESCESAPKGRYFRTYLDIFGGTPSTTSIFTFKEVTSVEVKDPILAHESPKKTYLRSCTNGDCKSECQGNSCGIVNDPNAVVQNNIPPRALNIDWRRLQ